MVKLEPLSSIAIGGDSGTQVLRFGALGLFAFIADKFEGIPPDFDDIAMQ